MSGFRDSLKGAGQQVVNKTHDLLTGFVDELHRSIVDGSELSGSPGQPFESGDLKSSWGKSVEGSTGVVSTNSPYAKKIEHGVGKNGKALQYHSGGGAHSLKKTAAAADRILEHVVGQVFGGGANG